MTLHEMRRCVIGESSAPKIAFGDEKNLVAGKTETK